MVQGTCKQEGAFVQGDKDMQCPTAIASWMQRNGVVHLE